MSLQLKKFKQDENQAYLKRRFKKRFLNII